MAGILPPVSTAFLCVVQKAFVPASDENDELIINSLGAIKHGLDALLKEDAGDYTEADKLWERAKQCLIEEQERNVGETSLGTISADDSFCMEAFPCGL